MREAVFYAQYTLENNWSRDVLEHQIESGLYERKGKAITNFKDKLPANASDLAIQTLKDPYSFDFLTIRDLRRNVWEPSAQTKETLFFNRLMM